MSRLWRRGPRDEELGQDQFAEMEHGAEGAQFSVEQGIGLEAVRGAGDSFVAEIDSVGKDIDAFTESWEAADNKINSFLGDPDIKRGFADAIANAMKHHHTNERDGGSARAARRLTDRDLPDFVRMQVLLARIANQGLGQTTRRFMRGDEAMTGGVRDALDTSRAIKDEVGLARGKWLAIKNSPCEHLTGLRDIFTSLEELQTDIGKDYHRAAKASTKVLEHFGKVIDRSPEKSMRLLIELPELVGSDQWRYKEAGRMLAADWLQYEDGSVLARAIDQVRSSGEKGIFLRDFLDSQLEGDRSTWVSFMRDILRKLDPNRPLDKLMSEMRDGWPVELEDAYGQFASQRLATIERAVKQAISASAARRLMEPSLFETGKLLDKWMTRTVGPPARPTRASTLDLVTKAQSSASEALPGESNATPETRKNKLETVMLASDGRDNKGRIYTMEPGTDVMDAILQKAAKGQDLRYLQDLKSIMRRLEEDPFGSGTSPVVNAKDIRIRELGEKKCRVFRFSARDSQGLSVGPIGDQTRVVFVVEDKKICVLGIFGDHDVYRRYIKTLL